MKRQFVPDFTTVTGEPIELEAGDKILYRDHLGFVVRRDGLSVMWSHKEMGSRDTWTSEMPNGPEGVAKAVARKYGKKLSESHKDQHGLWWTLED